MYDLGPISEQLPDRKTGKNPDFPSNGDVKSGDPRSNSYRRNKLAMNQKCTQQEFTLDHMEI